MTARGNDITSKQSLRDRRAAGAARSKGAAAVVHERRQSLMVSVGGGDSWKYFCPAVEGTAIVCLPASDFDVVVVRTSFSPTAVKASMSHLMSHHKTLLTKNTGFSQRIRGAGAIHEIISRY